jgi:hypothetical protein
VDTVVGPGVAQGDMPSVVRREVQRRRQALVERARGRVLDLDDPAATAVLAATLSDPDPAAAAGRYDTILVTGQLLAWPDLHAAVVALDRLLADDGDLFVLEPVNHPGLVGLVASSIGGHLPQARRRHLSRDVVATLRSVGLCVADLDRFTIPTLVWPLRRWVQARAVRIGGPAAEETGPEPR